MRKLIFALLVFAAYGCYSAQETRRIPHLVKALQDIYEWDSTLGPRPNLEYNMLVKTGEGAMDELIEALLDKTPTMLPEIAGHQVLVGDVAFLALVEITGVSLEDLMKAGVRIIGDPRDIYSYRFDPGVRKRVKKKFLNEP